MKTALEILSTPITLISIGIASALTFWGVGKLIKAINCSGCKLLLDKKGRP